MSRAMLAAAMKDKSARSMPERAIMKKVGGVFKQCSNCESPQVYKADEPVRRGWTYWCWTCGAYDEKAWSLPKAELEAFAEAEEQVMQSLRFAARLHELRKRLVGNKEAV